MKLIHRIAIAACIAFAAAAPAIAQQNDDAVATATAVLDKLEAGDYEGATTAFDANMKSKLDAVQLAGVQMQIEAAGAVQSRGEPQVSQRDGFTVVVHRIQREHAAIDATVAIDAEGKVAGLHFAPAAAGAQ